MVPSQSFGIVPLAPTAHIGGSPSVSVHISQQISSTLHHWLKYTQVTAVLNCILIFFISVKLVSLKVLIACIPYNNVEGAIRFPTWAMVDKHSVQIMWNFSVELFFRLTFHTASLLEWR